LSYGRKILSNCPPQSVADPPISLAEAMGAK